MVSFLLSLFVVDHWRLSPHASGQDSIWAHLTGRSWLDPEPYQDSHTGRSASADKDRDASYHSYRGWYTHKMHRAMAKLEINDAFEMRGQVMFVLLAGGLLGFGAIGYAVHYLRAWIL